MTTRKNSRKKTESYEETPEELQGLMSKEDLVELKQLLEKFLTHHQTIITFNSTLDIADPQEFFRIAMEKSVLIYNMRSLVREYVQEYDTLLNLPRFLERLRAQDRRVGSPPHVEQAAVLPAKAGELSDSIYSERRHTADTKD